MQVKDTSYMEALAADEVEEEAVAGAGAGVTEAAQQREVLQNGMAAAAVLAAPVLEEMVIRE